MAIQTRRGNYADFDPDKMLPGELATVTSGDPGAEDGRSVYACFAAGDVKRMATYEDMQENIDQATQDVQEAFSAQLTQKINQADTAISQAQTATSAANTAAQGADEAKREALEAAAAAESYVLGDISNKTVTFQEASARANINTGESTATLFGKIKKWLADLGAAAFQAVANNCTTNVEGSVLDARQGKKLQDQINQLNTNISSLQNSTDKMGVYDAWTNGQTTFNVVFKIPQNGGQYRPAFLIMGNVGSAPFMVICTVANLTENLVAATCADIVGGVASKMTINVNANLGDPSQLRIQIVTPANMGSRIQVLVPAGRITGQW